MRTERGFTLIEVMVAMVILSLALLELGKLQITALRTTSSASRTSEAMSIAQARVEQIMSLQYTDTQTAPYLANTTHTDPAPPPGYTVRWKVEQVEPEAKMVHVNVTQQNLNKTFGLSLRKILKRS
jgi:prepilin-type N-terminal cleavage/methylation domain-containing protein